MIETELLDLGCYVGVAEIVEGSEWRLLYFELFFDYSEFLHR